MGLVPAPGALQNLMKLMMAGMSCEVPLVYLDDIIIFGGSIENYLSRLDLVLDNSKTLVTKKAQCIFVFSGKKFFLETHCIKYGQICGSRESSGSQ